MNDVKIVECEVCMEKFPLDCFEFFPCTHKICFFCYNNLKQLQCPYCRINIDIDIRIKKNNSLITIDEEENNENNENNEIDYNYLNELPELPIQRNRTRNKNNRRNNRNYTERFGN